MLFICLSWRISPWGSCAPSPQGTHCGGVVCPGGDRTGQLRLAAHSAQLSPACEGPGCPQTRAEVGPGALRRGHRRRACPGRVACAAMAAPGWLTRYAYMCIMQK